MPVAPYIIEFVGEGRGKVQARLATTPSEENPLIMLKSRAKWRLRRSLGLALASPLAACLLSGCVTSAAPILTDAKPIMGERGEIHFFRIADGAARDHTTASFRWSGGRYVVDSPEISDLTVHAYEGRDLIVQATSAHAPHAAEYGLARKLADGVYRIVPLSEDDVDDATRARFCTETQNATCRITTPEQLFVFARAQAEKEPEGGGVAVIVAAPSR